MKSLITHCKASKESHPPNPIALPTTKLLSISSFKLELLRIICKLSKGFPILKTNSYVNYFVNYH